uniref:Uncharacterized protein n=1 Tax=Romanomermis culicivorax TaxID=13658 RepID=A0A915JEZ5_ROMCU
MPKTTGVVSVVASYRPTEVDKILLDGEPSSPAVDAVRHSVEQASCKGQPAAVVAALPSTTTTEAQTLAAIAQQQPVATEEPPPTAANAFGETLCTINNGVSIIQALPFQRATAPQSLKIGVLREVHSFGGLVIDFPGEEPISSNDDDKECTCPTG